MHERRSDLLGGIMKQTSFFKNIKKSFGPKDLIGKRKHRRPLSSRHVMHLVLRSEKVVKLGRFFKFKNMIKKELYRLANKFGIKIYRVTIAGNHIHLNIQIQSRALYVKFISAFTGIVALKILKSKVAVLDNLSDINKTLAPSDEKFWISRPFTRILSWGKDLRTALNYTVQNHYEALGILSYENRNANTLSERLWAREYAPASYDDQRDAAQGIGQMILNI